MWHGSGHIAVRTNPVIMIENCGTAQVYERHQTFYSTKHHNVTLSL